MTYPSERRLHRSRPFLGFVRRMTSACFRLIGRSNDRHLQRVDLSELEDHLLRDIGLSPEEVRRECAKPFWR